MNVPESQMFLYYVFSSKPSEKASTSLARVGTRAALNFSFAFLRRAWRSGMLGQRYLYAQIILFQLQMI